MVDVAVSEPERTVLVLRFADVGIVTYASLRVVGDPSRTVTWVVEEPILLAALDELAAALPDPQGPETRRDAIRRALTTGPFATPDAELTVAYILGVLLISAPAWQMLGEYETSPRAVLFVSPSARLARMPWGLLAVPTSGPSKEELIRARADAITRSGTQAARIPWQLADIGACTDGHRLIELVDVLMAVPPNVVHSPRVAAGWQARCHRPPLLVLDPRVPGQRPDSALGSVLGRPGPQTPLAQHFAAVMEQRSILPQAATAVELFRRSDADCAWLAGLLRQEPSRLVYVGHASAASGDLGHADRAALHLARTEPLTAAELMSLRLPIPPRVALLACESGGDYRFDEATGLVAAMILGGAELVTATLWSLPTTAGYRQFVPTDDPDPSAPVPAGPDPTGPDPTDPMAEVIAAVDRAHVAEDAGCAVNAWQREQMRRWRGGDTAASPLYWAALATFAVDGAL